MHSDRQASLDRFFRNSFGQFINKRRNKPSNLTKNCKQVLYNYFKKSCVANEDRIQNCEITQYELAETLGLKTDSDFIKQVFYLADKDKDGYLSKQEFGDVIITLINGSPEEKANLLLSLYDKDNDGTLSWDECYSMLQSFLELNGMKTCNKDTLESATNALFSKAGITKDEPLSPQKFRRVFSFIDHQKETKDTQEVASYGLKRSVSGFRKSPIKIPNPGKAFKTVENFSLQIEPRLLDKIKRFFETYKNQIIFLGIFYKFSLQKLDIRSFEIFSILWKFSIL